MKTKPKETQKANNARLDNRSVCGVGHAFRDFNPLFRFDIHPRPSFASASTLSEKL
jgi:formamidopyrimidine-DNA glycosylase